MVRGIPSTAVTNSALITETEIHPFDPTSVHVSMSHLHYLFPKH